MRYALITGASSGIGKEIAKTLAKEGIHLILVARREERLLELRKEIMKIYKVNVEIKVLDLSIKDNCYILHKECSCYNICFLVNNAGFGKAGEFFNIPLEDEIEMIHTNILSLHILTKLFGNTMKKGNILNVASMAGLQPDPLMSTYGATKSYVIQFSRAINYEFRRKGIPITVSTMCPGPVATEFQGVANVKKNKRMGLIGKIYARQIISAKKCANIAVRGMKNKQEIIYMKESHRIIAILTKFLPANILITIQYFIQRKKI